MTEEQIMAIGTLAVTLTKILREAPIRPDLQARAMGMSCRMLLELAMHGNEPLSLKQFEAGANALTAAFGYGLRDKIIVERKDGEPGLKIKHAGVMQ